MERGWELDGTDQVHEARYLKLDTSKAKRYLDWEPHWNLETALKKVVDWHAAWRNGCDMREVSEAQISAYQTLAM